MTCFIFQRNGLDGEKDVVDRGRKSGCIVSWGDTMLCLCVTFMEKWEKGEIFCSCKALVLFNNSLLVFSFAISFSLSLYFYFLYFGELH